jgi:hypothetical protein
MSDCSERSFLPYFEGLVVITVIFQLRRDKCFTNFVILWIPMPPDGGKPHVIISRLVLFGWTVDKAKSTLGNFD